MQRTFIIAIFTACLLGNAAHAAGKSSREETLGVGIGAAVGAVSGGPLGAIVGAAIGAKFGDTYHRKDERVAELSGTLATSNATVETLRQQVADLNGDIATLDADVERLRRMSRPELLALLKAGLEMDLLFRTDERVLAEDTSRRIAALAGSLASMPDVRVQLDGFADERGDAAYNERLSAARAAYVRDLLLANGVPAARISSAAHGESAAADASPDSYALERRVSLTLYIDDVPAVAANP